MPAHNVLHTTYADKQQQLTRQNLLLAHLTHSPCLANTQPLIAVAEPAVGYLDWILIDGGNQQHPSSAAHALTKTAARPKPAYQAAPLQRFVYVRSERAAQRHSNPSASEHPTHQTFLSERPSCAQWTSCNPGSRMGSQHVITFWVVDVYASRRDA